MSPSRARIVPRPITRADVAHVFAPACMRFDVVNNLRVELGRVRVENALLVAVNDDSGVRGVNNDVSELLVDVSIFRFEREEDLARNFGPSITSYKCPSKETTTRSRDTNKKPDERCYDCRVNSDLDRSEDSNQNSRKPDDCLDWGYAPESVNLRGVCDQVGYSVYNDC